jgi:hypothetical protein
MDDKAGLSKAGWCTSTHDESTDVSIRYITAFRATNVLAAPGS